MNGIKRLFISFIILQFFTSCNYKYNDTTPGLLLIVIPFCLFSTIIIAIIISKVLRNHNATKKIKLILMIIIPFIWAFMLFFSWNSEFIPYRDYSKIQNGNLISSNENTIALISHASKEWNITNNYACYLSIFEEKNNALKNVSNINLSKIEKKIMYVKKIEISGNYIAILANCGFDNPFIKYTENKILLLRKDNNQWSFFNTIILPKLDTLVKNNISLSIYDNYLAVGLPNQNITGCVLIYNLSSEILEPEDSIFPINTLPYVQELENVYSIYVNKKNEVIKSNHIRNYNETSFAECVLLCDKGLFVCEKKYNANYSGNYTIRKETTFNNSYENYYEPQFQENEKTKPIGRVLHYVMKDKKFILQNVIVPDNYSLQEFGETIKYYDDCLFVSLEPDTFYQYEISTGNKINKICNISHRNSYKSLNYIDQGKIYAWNKTQFLELVNNHLDYSFVIPNSCYISDNYLIYSCDEYENKINSQKFVIIEKIYSTEQKIKKSFVLEIETCTEDNISFLIRSF